MSEEKAHSQIGASSLYRWSRCPGSVKLSENIPSSTSKYAEEGTKAHDGAAHRIQKGRFPEEWSSGIFLAQYPDMISAVMTYVNRVEEIILTDKDSNDVVLIEHRFHLKQIHPDAFGTGDAVIYKHRSRTLYILDYKHGKGHVVDVKDNPQLKYYALGALLSLPEIRPTKVVSEIIQPRAYHEDGPIRSEGYAAADLLDFAMELKGYIAETEKPNAPIIPGDHCHFCPAKPHCPSLHKKSVEAAKQVFSPQTAYDPVKLADTLALLPAIEAWVKGVREFAYSEAEAGRTPPGYKLVPKRATRQFTDIKAVEQRIAARFQSGMIDECYSPRELKSVAQIEKVLGKKDFTAQVGDLVVAVSSGSTLVPESDKRDALTGGEAFTAIPSKEDFLS